MLGPYRLPWPVRAVVARMARKTSFVRTQEQARPLIACKRPRLHVCCMSDTAW